MTQNQQIRLAARPVGMPKPSDWTFTTESIAEPGSGQVLVKILYVSVDPAMRGWMNEGKSYIPPVGLGEVMRAGTAGKVIASNHPDFAVGDEVIGNLGVQEYALSDGKGLTQVDTSLASLPAYLGTLGMPGLTAYFGLLDTGQPKEGETVLVSGAAGAVGSVVGQIAKIKGCRAVGIAGGEEKCRYVVEELGFDACVDYKKGRLYQDLKEVCPQGIDVYFDNVGGEILDTALTQINRKARIVICGAISQYNTTTQVKGPANYLSLLVNRARMEGIVVFDNVPRYADASRQLAQWLREGRLHHREDIVDGGLQAFPETLLKLFKGENFGKLILGIATE
jgi:NADPH-dependent curcumin reductase